MIPSALASFLLVLAPSAGGDAPPPEPSPDQAAGQEDEDTLEERVARLEAENAELERRVGLLAQEYEAFTLRDIAPPLGETYSGLGPAASKVYAQDQGLSIGGYGELLYQSVEGASGDAQIDFLRAVLYFGYKFDERWVFNSEIEIEHADEVFVEFAYLDYLWREELAFRAGLLLHPMGLVNELHEPTSFIAATRPETEQRIIPTTWRENGFGVHGDAGPFEYRAYVLNGLDADGFSASGLRGGRQKGSKALAEDFAFVSRADYTDVPGLVAGGSFYVGDSGQADLPDTTTKIYELHADYRFRGLWLRGLWAMADLDDVAELNAAQGFTGSESVGEEMVGWYVAAAYDVLAAAAPQSGMELSPYVRFESIDTQEDVPSGFTSDPANDEEILTLGLRFLPLPQVVFKVEYEDWDRADDRWNAQVGYVF